VNYGGQTIRCPLLTLGGAGALLLVCLGLAALVVCCCAVLIVARTRIAPHADCMREMAAQAGTLENVVAWQRRHQKVKAGGAPAKKVPEEPAPEETPRVSDIELEQNAQKRLRSMLGKG